MIVTSGEPFRPRMAKLGLYSYRMVRFGLYSNVAPGQRVTFGKIGSLFKSDGAVRSVFKCGVRSEGNDVTQSDLISCYQKW